MDELNGWDIFCSGDTAAALPELQKELSHDPSDTLARYNLAFALAHARRYAEASRHVVRVIREDGEALLSSDRLAFDGLLKLFLGKPQAARRSWIRGLNAPYGDAAGGLSVVFCLYYAAVRFPPLVSVQESFQELRKCLTSRRARNWPGPIGRFLVGDITEADLLSSARDDVETAVDEQVLESRFFAGLAGAQHGNEAKFWKRMREVTAAKRGHLLTDWYLVARWEVEQQRLKEGPYPSNE